MRHLSIFRRLFNAASPVLRESWERLEPRVMLCLDHASLASSGVPESMIHDDGGILYSDYLTLSPKMQERIDPHLIEYPPIVDDPDSMTLQEAPEAAVQALPDFYPATSGSFSIDQTTQSGRTLLRFGTQVNNMGTGPGILVSGQPGVDAIPAGAPITSWVAADGSQNVLQVVYYYDSATNAFSLHHYLASGHFTYHSAHGHFHFDGYANYALRHNVGGSPGGYVTRTDGSEVVGAKTGFCLINVSSSFTLPGGGSSTTLPGYSGSGQPSTSCSAITGAVPRYRQGVHVGRADVYSSSLAGQWLDVTGVPNGSYFLEMQLDAENAIAETDETNNTKTFAVTLNASPPSGGISPDQFDTDAPGNNEFKDATDFGALGTYTQTGLTINWGLDKDYFRFYATSSGTYNISLTHTNGDVNLYLYNANEALLRSSTSPTTGTVTETVSYPFVKNKTYFVMAECYNSSVSSNYQVAFSVLPMTDATSPTPFTIEGAGQPGVFHIVRNGPTTNPLTINFTLGGTATNGVDYTLSADTTMTGSSITLGDLSSEANIYVTPVNDGLFEGVETVTLAISSSAAYARGLNNPTVTISDHWNLIADDDSSGLLTSVGPNGNGGASILEPASASLFSDRKIEEELLDL
ncbi:MAG: lysyl oxidase family protein [Tepidisphaeraceae bacterium]